MTNWKLITGGIVGFVALLFISWYFFSGSEAAPETATQTFGTADTRTDVTSGGEEITNTDAAPAAVQNQKVFKMHEGPVAGATFVQTLNPTTTIARFILSDNGRVFDLAVDSPGAVPRAISNTTIPGVARVVWVGHSAILQYLNQESIKTLVLTLPAATTSSAALAARLRFLPDNVTEVSASPDGTQISYLLRTQAGTDGYIALSDGTGGRKAYSLPLSHILLTWPTPNTIIAQAAPAYGVETVAFSINPGTGAVAALLHAAGMSLSADRALSRIFYHTASAMGRATYSHNMRSGLDTSLSFDPLPEQCIWSRLASSTAYCAAAATYAPENYLDLRNTGELSLVQQIVRYNESNYASIVAVPGTADGGVSSDIAEMALSLDERYLLFIRKGDRSLWGVRLAQ